MAMRATTGDNPWIHLVTIPLLVSLAAGCAPREVEVPDVRGDSVPDAVQALDDAGFTVKIDGITADDPTAEAWTVTYQQPLPGGAEPGATVTVRALSPLVRARDACGAGEVVDDGRAIILDMRGEELFSGDLSYEDVVCVLDELDVPESIHTKMGATRSLDGRLSDSWAHYEASWTYHPDDGLDVLVELD